MRPTKLLYRVLGAVLCIFACTIISMIVFAPELIDRAFADWRGGAVIHGSAEGLITPFTLICIAGIILITVTFFISKADEKKDRNIEQLL